MNIGQTAKSSGVSAKMIRYYEQTGLIPTASRTASGYRDYSKTDVNMLRFIRRARDLGFSIVEIDELLGLWRNKSRKSAEVKRLAFGHIEELDRKISGLQEIARTLRSLVRACHGDQRPDCPIIKRLESDVDGEDLTITKRQGAVRRRQRKRAS